MKLIELSQGRVAIVDDEDFEWLSKWKWHYWRQKHSKTGYAHRNEGRRPNRQIVRMHVAIMKRHKRWQHNRQVDHTNTCGCDNRKVNLRLATPSSQGANRKRQRNNTSGVTGVQWREDMQKWEARIKLNKKVRHLGLFEKKRDAIKRRQQAEAEHFKKYQHDPTDVCPLGPTGECPDCAARLGALSSS